MGFFRVLGAIVLIALAVGLAGAIFQTGYLAGIAADGGAPVVVGPGYGYGWHGWGFGGGLFGFLGMLLFFILFIGLLKAVFGGHRRGWGHGRGEWGRGWGPGGPGEHGGHEGFGPWESRARELHDEWHRRNPDGDGDAGTGTGGSGSTGVSGTSSGGRPA